MEKSHLPFEFDLFLTYPIIGRLQPVIALSEAISKLGTINRDNYVKFRYLQLELIVKQCELLSDIAGYINAIEKFFPKQSDAENLEMYMNVYKLLVSNRGNTIHDFYANLDSKNDQFFYEIMGYDILDSIKPNSDLKENQDALKNSVDVVKSIFREMSHFYKNFWNVYNAYKHGYRLFVNKAKCELVECSGVSGNLDILRIDSIVYVYKFGEPNKLISFSRSQAVYNHSFFDLFQGIINAFNIKLVTHFKGFLYFDLSEVNPPSIRVFRPNGVYSDIPLVCEFRSGDLVFNWQ